MLEVKLWKISVLPFCVGKFVCVNACALLISPLGQTALQSKEADWRVVGGRALAPSIPFCLQLSGMLRNHMQHCSPRHILMCFVQPGCKQFKWQASSSPLGGKNSSAITVGKTMRFQGNEGNLLENSSNVKGLLNVTVGGLLVWARDRLHQFYAYWQWHWLRALLYVSVLCCNLLPFLFWVCSLGICEVERL